MNRKQGAILVISGPSGAGKSSLLKAASPRIGEYYFSISTTTRAPREGEVDGVDYYFVSKETFEKGIREDNFLEYALVHGNYYGTSLQPVYDALGQGKLVIFDIDVQGYAIARKKIGNLMTSVFITTPSLEVLRARLQGRGTDDETVIARRLGNALREIEYLAVYDYLIINEAFEASADALAAIAQSARCKIAEDAAEAFALQWKQGGK